MLAIGERLNKGNLDDPHIQWEIGTLYYQNNDIRSLEWLIKSANQGYSDAQNHLGYMFLHGEYVTKDLKMAYEFIEKSAKQGNMRAQCTLGYMYLNGLGIVKDVEKAF